MQYRSAVVKKVDFLNPDYINEIRIVFHRTSFISHHTEGCTEFYRFCTLVKFAKLATMYVQLSQMTINVTAMFTKKEGRGLTCCLLENICM